MIIYFDGPDQSRKTTLAKSVSEILKIPYWERSPYLPHHHSNTTKHGNNIDLHAQDVVWYVLDDMKTIDVFKKLGGHTIIDRHPVVSDCVYRNIEGKISCFFSQTHDFKDDIVVLCHNGDNDMAVYNMYLMFLDKFKITYVQVDTSNTELAVKSTTTNLYSMLERR